MRVAGSVQSVAQDGVSRPRQVAPQLMVPPCRNNGKLFQAYTDLVRLQLDRKTFIIKSNWYVASSERLTTKQKIGHAHGM